MIANAMLVTVVVLLAYGFWLMDQLKFMARYQRVLYHAYGATIAIYLALLFANVFGAALLISRHFLLKNTGRKLSHLDNQLSLGHPEVATSQREEAPH
ncbi:MAG: hypothetical protein WA209_02660 [Candidatus Acidiferrales bacterium]